ncbi:MAG: D-alanyl-D-alanine carboxypeptidase family protein [Halanaerobium sp.]|nr:D-alanyl-D-alanine carboxypeptidase family protein [Halanaerobium sp.]
MLKRKGKGSSQFWTGLVLRCWLLLLILMLIIQLTPLMVLAEDSPEFDLKAKSAVLMEVRTGELIYEKNATEELPPASITKIMTMLIIMEALDKGRISLDDQVVVSANAARMGGSQVWLEVGEVMRLEDLLKTIAVVSANDSCVALAEHIAGSEQAFVKMMNERASELGLQHTNFVNTNGLPAENGGEGNYTCARDVAIMSRELLKYPRVLEYTSIWIDYIRDGKNVLNNTNKLVRHYTGVDGLKTGYTVDAKYCLSATGERNNLRFIAVVMACPDSETRFAETAELLAYGFSAFEAQQMAQRGEQMGTVQVFNGLEDEVNAITAEDLYIPLRRGDEAGLEKKITLQQEVMAPIKEGQVLGRITIFHDGRALDSVAIIASKAVPRAGIFTMIARIFRDFSSLVSEKIWEN